MFESVCVRIKEQLNKLKNKNSEQTTLNEADWNKYRETSKQQETDI